VVSKPFLVRLITPRFFTQDDTVTVAAVAQNLCKETLEVTVGLQAGALAIANGKSQEARVDAGAAHRFAWTVRAGTLGKAELRAWGTGKHDSEELTDAMALTVPVLPGGREQVDRHAGTLNGRQTLTFTVDPAAIPGTPRLSLRLSPSIASSLLGSLKYLAEYPYGCTEQTMSAFLPDVCVSRLLALRSGRSDNPSIPELPKMVQAGLLRLYGYQHDDGGWGWWEHDETDAWMTAYVVFGLT
jgi:uncharacterized protein YfaS (alpha-2-macroglobulin family)